MGYKNIKYEYKLIKNEIKKWKCWIWDFIPREANI